MMAIRMARVFTGREKVLKFEGGFHGLHDYVMVGNWKPGTAPYPTPVPDIAGIYVTDPSVAARITLDVLNP